MNEAPHKALGFSYTTSEPNFFDTEKQTSPPTMGLLKFNLFKIFSSWLAYSLISILSLNLGSSASNVTDRLSLFELKKKISGDPTGAMSSWNNSIDFCKWQGVECGRRHHRVTGLDLNSLQLSGSISPHIGNLSFLRMLLLFNNSFSDEIPAEIARLRRLQILSLNNNSLTGEIPKNISGCSSLWQITLSFNELTGALPWELSSLPKLRFLSVSANNLRGPIPSSIGNLSFLERIYLARNNFNGSIPEALGKLPQISVLALGLNQFSGVIPPPIFNLSSLTTLDVGINQIEGNLPANMAFTLPHLKDFRFAMNKITGPIPPSISNASNLWQLQAANNRLRGNVPSLENLDRLIWLSLSSNNLGNGGTSDLSFLCSVANATRLQNLAVSDNSFTGVLPECIANLSTTLTKLRFDFNLLHGSIPPIIGKFVNLERLGMQYNKFSGRLPSSIGNLRNLQQLGLHNNNLSGEIPLSLGNLENLTDLYLHGNSFQGSIPSTLSKLQRLEVLYLSGNNLSGVIPPELMSLSPLSILLNLSHNYLVGALPMEVGNLKMLATLDVSANMLYGEITSTLGQCAGLVALRMQDNFFKGSIPQSLGLISGIRQIDLSRNHLSGEIPDFFETFKYLETLNLSYNNFRGMLPADGIFQNSSVIIVMGNEQLCGGIPEFLLPRCKEKKPKGRRHVQKLRIAILSTFGLVATALVLALIYVRCLKKKKKKKNEEHQPNSRNDQFPNVSYGLLAQATDGFSMANLIGAGCFGSVYKGTIAEEGATVAVKVLHLQHHGALKSFLAECEASRNIRHRNLLKVLTVCSGIDYQGNDFKALVYDYMENGSLQGWLHTDPTLSEGDTPPKRLGFFQRLNIGLDIASALDYLHHSCQSPIIHSDLKPSNVLLDDEMVGHVGDFGLARFLIRPSVDSPANQMSSAGIRGTIGYAAPEYAMGSDVSKAGDVYSFGILLLELFTGLSPTNDMFKEDLTLHNFVKEAWPDRVLEITDPVAVVLLQQENDIPSTNGGSIEDRRWILRSKARDALTTIYGIGVTCSSETPSRRPSIAETVVELQMLKKKLLGAGRK